MENILNKKSRSNGGTRKRSSYDEGGGSASHTNVRSGGINPSYEGNRRSNHKPNHGHSHSYNNGAPNSHGLYDKNTNLAREALNDGDRVSAEYYFQNAEHHLRLMNERRRQQAAKNQVQQEQAQQVQAKEAAKAASAVKPEIQPVNDKKPLVEESQPEKPVSEDKLPKAASVAKSEVQTVNSKKPLKAAPAAKVEVAAVSEEKPLVDGSQPE